MYRPTWKSAKNAVQWRASLCTHVYPRIGRMRVDAITAADVMAVVSLIWSSKPETAGRLRQRTGTVMK